ncbi:schwannomin-interacting protein 1 isoform X2 [Xiphias gladius]|nr:schwannomin-interacting protein 1 isoform X2 [Xiphias gladius]XP_040006362.1 schwannomin-interacting protein 1 isoform X2 [Xiphias gladius]XP_040006363.1 schwannomin-interacting protein 1 isoform X2 [Xiphias gladius]XP_040006364.1 schwannomin-interacting protein 1 isoform X2 [Xiphias gladius]
MEGEKETAEEKEEEEEEEKELHHHIAAASSVDYQDLPIMHWEELSQRIAELEKQEQERRERAKVSMGTGHNGCHAAGLKQEVATALRTLRDQLLAEQKEKEAGSSGVAKRKHLERWELQECSVQQLSSLRASLQQDVHALSSELVAHLLVRDQLRTKQDAMLLDVQDLT